MEPPRDAPVVSTVSPQSPRFGSEDQAGASLDSPVRDLAADTDLPRVTARVKERALRRLVVAAEAMEAWEARDPAGWRIVSGWLAARGVVILIARRRP